MEIEQQKKSQEILKSIANGNDEETITTTPKQNGNSSPPEKETSSRPSAVSASATDPEKRKSVSFVDEKLIINAIKSTSINDNNDSVTTGATQPVKRSNSLKSNGKYGDGNKRQTYNNQKHYSNNFNNYHHHNNNYNHHHHNNNHYAKHQKQHGYDNVEKSSSSTSINHSNPVIIYYGSPDVKIDVDDLLNKCQQIQQPKQQQQLQQKEKKEESNNIIEKKNQQKSFNSKTKMNSTINNNNSNSNNNNNNKNQSNHYRNHNNKNYGQNYRGGHRYNNNHSHQNNGSSAGGSNNDNWRSNQNHNNHQNNIKKYSDHDDRCADGKNYGDAIGGGNRGGFSKKRGNGHFNGSGSRDNRRNVNVNNNESSGNKAEPITIYYNDTTVSLEENLELLKTKLKEKTGNTTDLETGEAEVASKNDDDNTDGDKTNEKSISSQSNNDVINQEINSPNKSTETETNTKTEPIANTGVESEDGVNKQTETISPIITSDNINNHEDVISGGVPIENPCWPAKPGPHKVACTLVSHPGHFYIKFLINEQHQQQLSSMTEFYQNEEHIELTIDVLKPGQYFAASTTTTTNDEKEAKWIRVKLLHIESSDSINCLLIDEGCFGVFKLNKLQPLYNRFRSVPKQAIRVALSGVRPKENDWLPNEALEFKKLIENRLLKTGAYVGSDDDERKGNTIDPDQNNGNSTTEIELFFNEDDQDTELANKSVADVLIEKNIATKK